MVTRKENKGLAWDGGDLGKLSKDKQVMMTSKRVEKFNKPKS